MKGWTAQRPGEAVCNKEKKAKAGLDKGPEKPQEQEKKDGAE